jgi:beta-lactamase regulating signal transducer with metallopeptidase domain
MQSFVVALLTCSVTMSALALFYMAIIPLLAKRYSGSGRYYAWLVIVIGLIIPFRPQFNNVIIKVNVPSETMTPIFQIGNGMPKNASIENAALTSVFSGLSWWQIAVAVWLAVVIAFFTYHIIKHFCFVKMVRRWSENITDGEPFTLLQSLKSAMGISNQISLYRCSSIGSPMMIGFVNFRILLPNADFTQDELRFILKHELVHYKRKDLYYKSLALIAIAMHWFNPVVYLMVKAIDIQCELSCDIEVVRSTDTHTRQRYSETIIGVVKYQSKLKTALSTNFYGGKKGMIKRISSILDTTKKKVGAVLICAAFIGILGTGFAFAANVVDAHDGYGYFDRMYENRFPAETADAVSFSDMAAWWDTGWGDDEFVLTFWIEGYSDISEYGIKCWDSNGIEIAYLDGPSHFTAQANGYFCIGAIDTGGSYAGNLVIGETYSWIAYAVRDGERFESPVNTFVLSTEGTRFGK